jgi:hypothetical protein
LLVIPAQAGQSELREIFCFCVLRTHADWIPAFAGMTGFETTKFIPDNSGPAPG